MRCGSIARANNRKFRVEAVIDPLLLSILLPLYGESTFNTM